MRQREKYLLLVVAMGLAGCGGSGGGSAPIINTDQRSEVQSATLMGLRLVNTHGDIDLGLAARGTQGSDGWTAMTYDAKRSLWNRQLAHWESPEGPDGVSSINRMTIKIDYYTDEAMTIPAGHSTRKNEQVEFYGTETDTITEKVTKGPLKGYNYSRTSVTNLGTMEVTTEMTATHPELGAIHTVSQLSGFTTTMTKSGREDKYVQSADGEPVTVTLADGVKIVVDISAMTGAVTSGTGETLGQIAYTESGDGTITWTNGDVTTFKV